MAGILPNIDIDFPSLPPFPRISGLVPDVEKGINDPLVPDERIRLSEAIERYTGWTGNDANIAKAVILAESSGNQYVDNGECCVGLLQISRVHAGKYGSPSDPQKFTEWLKNPGNNLRFGYALWQDVGGDWNDPGVINTWEVLLNGSYRKFLNSQQDPYVTINKRTLSDVALGAAGKVADAALGPVDEFVGSLLSGDVWFRIAKFGGGALLIVIGGVTLASIAIKKGASNPAVQTAASVVPAGKAASAASRSFRSTKIAGKMGRPHAPGAL